MPKNFKKKGYTCDRHDFSLKPRNEYTVQPQYFQVSFCAKQAEKRVRAQGTESVECLNCPTFNRDANFATPTFILASEQVVGGRTQGRDDVQGECMRQEHERRMVNYTDEKTSLNVPKPRSKNSYCSVCRHNYLDYLEHIESPQHRKRIKGSEFNRHILDLTYHFRRSGPRQDRGVKSEHREADDEESVEIISNPYKRIKPNETLTNTQRSRTVDWGQQQRLGFSYGQGFEQAMADPHRPIPTFHDNLNNLSNYNFNINMNLYLNNLPVNPVPGFMGQPHYPNPYLDLQYQSIVFSQLNQLSQNFNPYCPQPQQQYQNQLQHQAPGHQLHQALGQVLPYYGSEVRSGRPITYIVIDE